jgi:hypothetical protein
VIANGVLGDKQGIAIDGQQMLEMQAQLGMI